MFKQAGDSLGLTLIELMVVVAIIAILASIGVVTYSGMQQRARVLTQNNGTNGTTAAPYWYQTAIKLRKQS